MAKGDINLHIGTTYDGEGFKKLNNAIKASGGEMKKASSAMNNVVSQLGSMENQAGKTVGAIGNIMQSFATMGIVGGVVAVGTLAIQGLCDWLDRTNKKLEEMREAFAERVKEAIDNTASSIKSLNAKFQEFIGIDKMFAERRKITESGTTQRMELDKRDALRGKSGEDAAEIEIEWVKKIEAERTKASQKRVEDVRAEMATLQENLDALYAKRAKKEEEFKEKLEESVAYNNVTHGRDSERVRIKREEKYQAWNIAQQQMFAFDAPIEELEKKLEELKTQRMKAVDEWETQKHREETAIKDAEQKLADEIKKADEAEAKLEEERLKKLEQEKKQAELDKKKAADEEERKLKEAKKQAEEEARKKQQAEDLEHKRKIRSIEEETAKKLKELNPEIEKMKQAADKWSKAADEARGKNFNQWNKEQKDKRNADDKDVQGRVKNIMQAENKRKQLSERIFDRRGKLKASATQHDVREWQSLNEFLSLQPEANEKTREAAKREQDKIGKRIFDKHGRLKGGASKDDVERWKTLQKNFINPVNPVENLKAKEEERNKVIEKQQLDIAEIRKKLDKLGL